MSSSDSKTLESDPDPQTQPSKSPIDPKTQEDRIPEDSLSNEVSEIGGEEGEGEEEEGECPFCAFMKGGGCRDSFIAWENCIEEAEKNQEDIVEKCFEVTSALKKCMEANADYYEPIFRAEKHAEEEALNELEKEKEAPAAAADDDKGSEQSAGSDQDAFSKDLESREKKEG